MDSWKNVKVDSNEKCMHEQCEECHGTGRKEDGRFCVHMISCPCPKCNPGVLVNA